MDDVTLLQECVMKVEEIKEELIDTFGNRELDMLGKNSDEVNSPVAGLLQLKMEKEEEQETKPIATLYLFPMEEEQLEDPLAVDPLAGCEERAEKKPLVDTLLLRVKKEEAGMFNERGEHAAAEEMDDVEDASGSNRAGTPTEEHEASKTENKNVAAPSNRQSFECVHCSETFRYKRMLKEHEQEHRREPQLFKCDMCQQQFTFRRTLVRHMRMHMNKSEKNTKFPCETCGKEFKHQHYLQVHLRVHTGEKLYVCDNCGRRFAYKSQLNVHCRKHTGEQPYSCSICNKRFARKNDLVVHTRRHLNIKPYECKECGKAFVQSSHYNRHLDIHTGKRPYKCSVCSGTFLRKWDLNYHMITHNRGQKPKSECNVCGESITTKNMNCHMRTHTGQRPYKCGYCEKTFAHSRSRKKHEATHTKEYSYNCAECGKGFCDKSKLVKHILSHEFKKSGVKRKRRTKKPRL